MFSSQVPYYPHHKLSHPPLQALEKNLRLRRAMISSTLRLSVFLSNIEWKYNFLRQRASVLHRCSLACSMSSTLHEIAWAFGASPRTPLGAPIPPVHYAPPSDYGLVRRPLPSAVDFGKFILFLFFFQGPITCMYWVGGLKQRSPHVPEAPLIKAGD